MVRHENGLEATVDHISLVDERSNRPFMRTRLIVCRKTVKEDDSFRLCIHAPVPWGLFRRTTGPLPDLGVRVYDNIARVDTDPIIDKGFFYRYNSPEVEGDRNAFSAFVGGLVGFHARRQTWR